MFHFYFKKHNFALFTEYVCTAHFPLLFSPSLAAQNFLQHWMRPLTEGIDGAAEANERKASDERLRKLATRAFHQKIKSPSGSVIAIVRYILISASRVARILWEGSAAAGPQDYTKTVLFLQFFTVLRCEGAIYIINNWSYIGTQAVAQAQRLTNKGRLTG